MTTKKEIEITRDTLINAEVAQLVTQLSPDDAAIALLGMSRAAGARSLGRTVASDLVRLKKEKILERFEDDDIALAGIGRVTLRVVGLINELIQKMRADPAWGPLLSFYDSQNQHLVAELGWYLSNLGADDDGELGEDDEGDGGRSLDLALKPQDDDEDDRLK
jgi:hypothetical protein